MDRIPHRCAVARFRTIGIASLITALAAGSTWAQAFPPKAADAAREFDPELMFPSEGGIAHIADFDGDEREDVAAVLTARDRRALVVFRATREGYEAHPLYASLPAGDLALRLVPAGRHRVLDPQGMIEHENPAIELVFPGRSSALYVWRDGRFRVFELERR
jgi:hypothetical protein